MRESRTKRLASTLKQPQEAAPNVPTDVWEFELKESVRTALSTARKVSSNLAFRATTASQDCAWVRVL